MRNLLLLKLQFLTLLSLVSAWGETAEEVAYRARSLLVDRHTFGVGVLSTTFPKDHSDEDLRGKVSSGAEYFAACYGNGDLLMLATPVSQNWRNTIYSDSHNATIGITSSADPSVVDPRHASRSGKSWDPKRPSWRRGMPSKQRMTLYGHFERVEASESVEQLASCYIARHPDAKHWAPGAEDSPHVAYWTRFVVDRVYRVGGFGDESSIGWVDIDLWRAEDVRDTTLRLPIPKDSKGTLSLFQEAPPSMNALYLD